MPFTVLQCVNKDIIIYNVFCKRNKFKYSISDKSSCAIEDAGFHYLQYHNS